jgi:predicted PurR-regulated permease PerM
VSSAAPERSAGLIAARLLTVFGLGAAAYAVLSPFVKPMLWAAILVYLTWPLFRRVRAHARRPRLAAALFTLAVAVGIGIPVALLLVALANQAPSLLDEVRRWRMDGAALPLWLEQNEWLRPLVERLRATLDELGPGVPLGQVAGELSRRIVAVASGIGTNTFKFAVTMVTLYAFYVSGERILGITRSLAGMLLPGAPEGFIERIGNSVRAVVFGLIGTGLVQGALTALGLAVAGVPSPIALGAATVFLSLVPGGGSAVSVVSALWLGFHDRWLAGVLLAGWGIGVVSSVDNFLRPLLISAGGGIPFLLVFFGVLGGLAAFGLVGLFLGPVILSVAFTLVVEFVRSREAALAHPGPEPAGDAPPHRAP